MMSLPYAFRFLLVLSTLTACSASALSEELIVNGGFETPLLEFPPGQTFTFTTIGPGSEPAGFAWEVFQGTVDLGRGPNPFVQFPPEEGEQALDMAGNDNGGISQAFATVPGQAYRLSFQYTDNPVQAGDKRMDFALADVIPGTPEIFFEDFVTHGTATNGPPPASNAVLYESVFVAVSSLTRLYFVNTTLGGGNSAGIILDAVSVTAVPEPHSVLLALCGVATLFGTRRMMRRQVA